MDDAAAALEQSAIAVGDAVERALAEHRLGGQPPWAQHGIAAIDRGAMAIVPLAGAPVGAAPDAGPGAGPDAGLAVVHERLLQHWGYRHGGHDFRVGRLDPDDGYGRRIVETGGTGRAPIWWPHRDLAVVLVRAVDATGTHDTLALHVVPLPWVHAWPPAPATKREASARRSAARRRAEADIAWSWTARPV